MGRMPWEARLRTMRVGARRRFGSWFRTKSLRTFCHFLSIVDPSNEPRFSGVLPWEISPKSTQDHFRRIDFNRGRVFPVS